MLSNILEYTLFEFEDEIMRIGEKKFRAKQIYGWVLKGVDNFGEMKNLPKGLVEKLNEHFTIELPKAIEVQVAKLDGTRKYLLELSDGNCIEAVFMKYKYGNTICVSSQAGCKMGCKFCASTLNGLTRNLTQGEIVGQIIAAEKESGEKINHVVVMGIGEPFDNYENLYNFLTLVNDKDGLNIGMRNITVSTCGIIPMIYKFANDFPQVNLAISLHASSDAVRREIMPINDKYPIKELLIACERYVNKTHRRITFEYTLVDGKNDRIEDAKALAKLLDGLLCHVNLIPLNPVLETGLKKSRRDNTNAFLRELEKRGIQTTVRRELGNEIDAACGQLRLKK
ncbi:MAG: 23S rRNA (adenine(2503)-C(2))-methyltransferase RlmN [Peptostreptococcaceae bacterium]|nr:23S rRNA (adenine(2503)-C(2))-methyltransferase RlmN [Peptostreptococcaceae bacterium]